MSRPLSLVHPPARLRHRSQVATSWKTKQGRNVNPMPRPPFCPTKTVQVVTSKKGSRHQLPWGSQNHVATSNRCCDITQANPGRDLETGSRHCFSCPASSQVATPKPGRDPPRGYPMSRHQFHVATSFMPTVGFPSCNTKNPGRNLPHYHPCCDLKNDVATSNQTGHITTSNF